jgi:hypothetical protein
VCWEDGEWRAQIDCATFWGGGGWKDLGSFASELEAALAYDQPAQRYFWDKAQLNFPDLPPQPDDTPTEGFPPSQRGPRPEPPACQPSTLTDCLFRGASGERDLEQPSGESEALRAREGVPLSHDPTTPSAPSQYRGELRPIWRLTRVT